MEATFIVIIIATIPVLIGATGAYVNPKRWIKQDKRHPMDLAGAILALITITGLTIYLIITL